MKTLFVILGVLLLLPIGNAQKTEEPGVTPDSLSSGLDKATDQLVLLSTFDRIEEVIEIEKMLEVQGEEVEQTFGELKVTIKVQGELTKHEKFLINHIVQSLIGHSGEVLIEITDNKIKIKIEIDK